jgi:sugar phosphate isomerase/epimerase
MHNNVEFGIVQGRLIQSPKGCLQWFPQGYWESEFCLASAVGYNYIELIAERQHNKDNPVWTDEGIRRIKALTDRNKLSLHAICNDYIIDHSLTENKSSIEQTVNLISQAKLIGIQKLILPLFEKSEIREDNFQKYKIILKEIASAAQENNILVCLETILNGKSLLKLLDFLDHSNIKCVFDTGNRIGFEHDIYSDILLLGKQIHHVHIKDKNDQNENVLLGTGKVNFYKVFESLLHIEFGGPYTFETARGKDPVKTAKYNLQFVNYFMEEVSGNGS